MTITTITDKEQAQALRIKELEVACKVALEALCLPCDRWNATQYKLVSTAITQLTEVLK
jgi:hypothetical protein